MAAPEKMARCGLKKCARKGTSQGARAQIASRSRSAELEAPVPLAESIGEWLKEGGQCQIHLYLVTLAYGYHYAPATRGSGASPQGYRTWEPGTDRFVAHRVRKPAMNYSDHAGGS